MSGAWIGLFVALWLVVMLLVVLVLGLIRRVKELEGLPAARGPALPTVGGPPVGSSAPVVAGYERLTTSGRGSLDHVVLFLGSSCGACRKLAGELKGEELETLMADSAGEIELVVVTDPDGGETFAGIDASEVFMQTDGELSRAWAVPGTPFAVAIDRFGVVRASGFANTLWHLREFTDTLQGVTSPMAPSAIAGVEHT